MAALYSKAYSIFGSILGSPIYGNYPILSTFGLKAFTPGYWRRHGGRGKVHVAQLTGACWEWGNGSFL